MEKKESHQSGAKPKKEDASMTMRDHQRKARRASQQARKEEEEEEDLREAQAEAAAKAEADAQAMLDAVAQAEIDAEAEAEAEAAAAAAAAEMDEEAATAAAAGTYARNKLDELIRDQVSCGSTRRAARGAKCEPLSLRAFEPLRWREMRRHATP
eukprot:1082609-Pyramimonas_sp.AAC.1